jgi:hypothetical protein
LFMFHSLRICKKMYFFLHDLGQKRYVNLCEHFNEFGRYFFPKNLDS